MPYIEFFSLLATLIGMFFWNRSESRADIRHMDVQLQSNRELVRAIHEDAKSFQLAMIQESKDFHGRLCSIEERNREKR